MRTIPDVKDMKTLAEDIERPCLIPVVSTGTSFKSPSEMYLSLREDQEFSFLLESMGGPQRSSRYSVIGYRPLIYLKVEDDDVVVEGESEAVEIARRRIDETEGKNDGLEILKKAMFMDEMRILSFNLPRYVLGITGYLGYDYIRSKVDLASGTIDDLGHPLLEFILPRNVIVFDHHDEKIYYASLIPLTEDFDFEGLFSESVRDLSDITTSKFCRKNGNQESISMGSNFEKENFEESVEIIKDYIRAGDVIQTVISRRIDLEPSPDLGQFYSRLRSINPSPYMFFLDFAGRSLIGSSPEALVRVQDRKVLTRPIAGTRKRGKNEKEDEEMERDLLQDEKERAEHVMLVDLGRNDIGKVSKFGSVVTPEFMEIEKYGDVQHIVSTVEAELRDHADAFDALRAVFPAGTVTGAPKVRAMEIIDELEPTRRGIYSGAVGSFSYTGDADFAITIRTLTAENGKAQIQVGAGIVADSIPEKEYYETQSKARSLLRAIGVVDESGGN